MSARGGGGSVESKNFPQLPALLSLLCLAWASMSYHASSGV